MKNYFLIILVVELCMGSIAPMFSQGPNSGFDISLANGLTFAGPVGQAARYLEEQGFDDQNVNGFFGEVDYPVKNSVGGSIALNLSKKLTETRYFNIQLGYSKLGRVSGSGNSETISLDFHSMYGAAYYSFFMQSKEIRLGSVLLSNWIIYNESAIKEVQSKESGVTIGVTIGVGLKLWNSSKTYGRLNLDYMYALPNKFTPVTLSSNELTETKISFRHAKASFIFGVHL